MATPQILPITHKMKPGFAELQARGYLVSAEAIKVGKFTRVKFARRATHPSEQDSDQTLPEAHSDAAQDLVDDATNTQKTPLAALYERHGTSEELREVWAVILREFELALPWASYSMVMGSALVAVEEGEAVIATEPRYQSWMEQRLQPQILSKLNLHLDEVVTGIRSLGWVKTAFKERAQDGRLDAAPVQSHDAGEDGQSLSV